MSEEFEKAESLFSELKEYVNTRVAQAKLSIAEKLSIIITYAIMILMVALVFFLFLVLLCVAGALAIGQWLENIWLGFIIMAALSLLLGLLMWMAKDRILRKPIMNLLIKTLFENDDENEKD
jgi:uncharacterized membrane protein YbhN (UPF0104 family)